MEKRKEGRPGDARTALRRSVRENGYLFITAFIFTGVLFVHIIMNVSYLRLLLLKYFLLHFFFLHFLPPSFPCHLFNFGDIAFIFFIYS
jgi:hypothetical protein